MIRTVSRLQKKWDAMAFQLLRPVFIAHHKPQSVFQKDEFCRQIDLHQLHWDRMAKSALLIGHEFCTMTLTIHPSSVRFRSLLN